MDLALSALQALRRVSSDNHIDGHFLPKNVVHFSMENDKYVTDNTFPVFPLRAISSVPEPTSQSLIVLSSPPEANVLPSGLYVTENTLPVCPLRVVSALPEVTFQSLIVPSWFPEANVWPSGLYAKERTIQPPLKVTGSFLGTTFQSLIFL